jgi:lipopolysaccharide/colanic/teichoic acid biosynthesis glycosyltransferase
MYLRLKRILDVIFVLLLIFLFLGVFVLICLFYLMLAYGDVFFCQQRIGYRNKPFVIYKFRTLKAETNSSLQERRFPLGDFLRKFSLDEIPQLWNVLKGDMSLIGPRPLPIAYLGRFSTEQIKRHNVRPGITGLAQVNGRNSLTWDQKFEFDLFYVNNVSFLLDLKILIRTIILLFSFRKDVSLDEPEFLG